MSDSTSGAGSTGSGDLIDEMLMLIMARFEQDISAEQFQRLEYLVIHDADARRIYLDYMRDSVSLAWWASTPDLSDAEAERIYLSMQEAFLASSIAVKGQSKQCAELSTQRLGPPAKFESKSQPSLPLSGRAWAAVTAGAIALSLIAIFSVSSMPESDNAPASFSDNVPAGVARLTKSASTQFESNAKVGDTLTVGKMVLNTGTAQIDFDDGSRMTIEGIADNPAVFELKSEHHVALIRGRIVAKARDGIVGFTVSTPKYDIVDLGTEFAVEMDESGEIQVHVFDGKVEIRPVAGPNARSDPNESQSALLVEGEAVVISDTEKAALSALSKTIADATRFTRDIDQPALLHLDSTGRGLDLHIEDPNWRVVAATSVPSFTPGQAVVVSHSDYIANDRETSQWISYADSDVILRSRGDALVTFETTVDLTGCDPLSAQISIQFAVDNQFQGCRVNGDDVPLPMTPEEHEAVQRMHSFVIDRGFHDGVNTIQFDVQNIEHSHRKTNALAVRMHMKGTANRIVQRLNERTNNE